MTHYPEDLTLNQEDKVFAHYIIQPFSLLVPLGGQPVSIIK